MGTKKKKTAKLTIEFDNEKAAKHFMSWLSGQGEQDYWLWMEYREQKEPDGDITALDFKHTGKLTYKAVCGRINGQSEDQE